MEISVELKSRLGLMNNTNNLTDDGFRKLLDNAFATLLNKPDIHNIATLNSSKSDIVKEIYASLLMFIVKVTRHNCSLESIRSLLSDDLGFSPTRQELFCRMYENQKERLKIAMSSVGTHPPHIVDANWKMDYIIKTNVLDQPEGPIYRIRLSTEVFDVIAQKKKLEYIHFCCNTQQLQDLVYKLKDAVRHCEKLSAEN